MSHTLMRNSDLEATVRRGWIKMSNCYYEKIELYAMQWDGLDLSKCHVAVAPFGGLVAVAPCGDSTDVSQMKTNKVDLCSGRSETSTAVKLSCSAGYLICTFRCLSSRRRGKECPRSSGRTKAW